MANATRSISTTAADLIRDSVFAGLLGASAVAIVFMFFDFMDGRPLFTPSLIGSVLFLGVAAEDVAAVQPDAIVYYSLAHLLAFAAFGTALALMVHEVELHSKHPIVVWLALFTTIEVGFYIVAALVLPGVVGILGVVRVGVANLVAAGAITAFFVFYHHAAVWEKLKFTNADFIFDAFYSGAIGGSAVGLFFLLIDAAEGQPLFTPGLMGSVLLLGIPAEDVVGVQLNAVAYFSAVHMASFAVLGTVISLLVHEVELHSRHPAVVLGVFFALIEAGFFAMASLGMPGVIERLGIVRVVVANLVAAVSMTVFFVWSYHQMEPEQEAPPEPEGAGSHSG